MFSFEIRLRMPLMTESDPNPESNTAIDLL